MQREKNMRTRAGKDHKRQQHRQPGMALGAALCAVGPMTSALAAAPAPQVLDASSGRSGRQGSTCNNWCGMPQVQEVRPMQCGVLWFVHISKNGGSTAWDYLKKNAAPNGWKTADFGAQAYALGGPKRWRWNRTRGRRSDRASQAHFRDARGWDSRVSCRSR